MTPSTETALEVELVRDYALVRSQRALFQVRFIDGIWRCTCDVLGQCAHVKAAMAALRQEANSMTPDAEYAGLPPTHIVSPLPVECDSCHDGFDAADLTEYGRDNLCSICLKIYPLEKALALLNKQIVVLDSFPRSQEYLSGINTDIENDVDQAHAALRDCHRDVLTRLDELKTTLYTR